MHARNNAYMCVEVTLLELVVLMTQPHSNKATPAPLLSSAHGLLHLCGVPFT